MIFEVVEIFCAIIAATATVLSTVLVSKVNKEQKRTAARAERRALESRLAMELMYSTCALSLTTSKKLAGMHTNGDVEEAMQAAEKAQSDYIDLCREQAANNFAKI